MKLPQRDARLSGVKLIIETPPREEQLAFNRARWAEVLADESLAEFPGRVETNGFGNILMMPLPSGSHSHRTMKIQLELLRRLGGMALPECPVSTMDGVRAADVGWYSEDRFHLVEGQQAFEIAPEICVEVLSPSNREAEMNLKKELYFEAGAVEVWFCGEDGSITFHSPSGPLPESARCLGFPAVI